MVSQGAVSEVFGVIAEPGLVNFWLIAGTQWAVLLDTGCAISLPFRRVSTWMPET